MNRWIEDDNRHISNRLWEGLELDRKLASSKLSAYNGATENAGPGKW